MPVLHWFLRSIAVISPIVPRAKSDAAKLQHSVLGLRWKRVRNSGYFRLAYAAPGVLGREMFCRKAVPKHVRIFLKTDLIWRTHYAHLARHRCFPRTPCGIWFPEDDSHRGRAAYRRRRCRPRST